MKMFQIRLNGHYAPFKADPEGFKHVASGPDLEQLLVFSFKSMLGMVEKLGPVIGDGEWLALAFEAEVKTWDS